MLGVLHTFEDGPANIQVSILCRPVQRSVAQTVSRILGLPIFNYLTTDIDIVFMNCFEDWHLIPKQAFLVGPVLEFTTRFPAGHQRLGVCIFQTGEDLLPDLARALLLGCHRWTLTPDPF